MYSLPMKNTICLLYAICLFYGISSLFCQEETFGVPIPVVGTSPNGGAVMGVLLAVVTETDGHIDSIIAPVVTQNELVGLSADMNYFGFPSENITYQLYFSHSSENFWEYSIKYKQKQFFWENLSLDALFRFSRDSSNRFYGLGQQTEDDDETSYTSRNIQSKLQLTSELRENFFLSFAMEPRQKWIRRGIIEDVPSIKEKFSDVPGIEGGYVFPIRLAMIYDTRNNEVSPTSGTYCRFFLEGASQSVLSSFSYQKIGLEGKTYLPLDDDSRFVLVLRGLVEYMEGSNVPFYELSSLGGETFRGFGEGRFYDKHRFQINVEQRIRLVRFFVGEILLDVEGAVFAEFGQVFPSFKDVKTKDIQKVFGVAIRFVVRSQIVAKVDIGYGDEGSAIFAGLHYPF